MAQHNIDVNDRYAWIDIETTGLDPEQDSIIQIAAIVTDADLNKLGHYESLVAPFPDSLENMNDYVLKMHTRNGLLQKVQDPSVRTVQQVGDDFAFFLSLHKKPNSNMYMAGNSLAGVDIPFTRMYMPQIYENFINEDNEQGSLHYRSIDITGFRLALGLITKQDFCFEKIRKHDAMDDVHNCIEEFKFLSKNIQTYHKWS